MNILVLGSGGREHAICEALSQSPLVKKVIVAPGNAGMLETLPDLEIENIDVSSHEDILKVALKHHVGLTIVGPEAILSEGIVDLFQKEEMAIVGPTKAASLLETSKTFAKKVMIEAGVPTASYQEFFEVRMALEYIDDQASSKMVVKCDGLAQGKGVIVCHNKEEARKAVIGLMEESLLGKNVEHIIIEEYLEGHEVSMFALCDGENFTVLGSASDHKRLFDGDLGPNTGGMGAFSPAIVVSEEDWVWIREHVFSPVLSEMKRNGTPFTGFLFAGLMKTYQGWKVLEFNVRLGDPETQAILPLIDEDLTPWLMASADGSLRKLQLKVGRHSPKLKGMRSVHVVMAAHGYPGVMGEKVRSGDKISFSEVFNLSPYDFLFCAGVKKEGESLVTSGGRVLGITSLAETYTYARVQAYEHLSQIDFDGAQYRQDIAKGLI